MNKTPFKKPACGLLIFLASCVGPLDQKNYTRIEIPEHRTREIETIDLNEHKLDPNTPAPAAPAELQLSIEECRLIALKNNLDIQVELLSPTLAQQTVSEEEAAFEALLFGSASLARTDTPTASALSDAQSRAISSNIGVSLPLTTGGTLTATLPLSELETNNAFSTLNPSYNADARFSISQPLLRNAGPRTNTHAIRVARYESKIVEARTKLKVMSVLADVDKLYWRLYAARRDLEVRLQDYKLAQDQLETAKRRQTQGVGSELDVASAQSGAAAKLEAIINAEATLQTHQRDLKMALNMSNVPLDSVTVIVPTSDPNPVVYNLDAPKLADAAMDRRMDLLELELQFLQDTSAVDFARNQVLPLVNLDYTYGVNGLGDSYGSALRMVGDKEFEDHIVSLSVQVPLGNQAAMSRLRRAIYSRIQRASTKSAKQLFIRKEVVHAAAVINTSWQRIQAAQQTTLFAARTYEGEKRQYEQGLRTSTDVLDAQTKLADAQSKEVQAIADYQIAQIDLAVATGTLLGAGKVRWEPTVPSTK